MLLGKPMAFWEKPIFGSFCFRKTHGCLGKTYVGSFRVGHYLVFGAIGVGHYLVLGIIGVGHYFVLGKTHDVVGKKPF